MISRSNYAAILLIMCCVFAMFQLTGISENVVLATGENVYAADALSDEQAGAYRQSYEQQARALQVTNTARAEVGLVGGGEECLEVGRAWSIAQKKTYCRYDSLQQAVEDDAGADFLIVDGTALTASDAAALETLSQQGRHVVVSGLPSWRTLQQAPDLCRILGIARVSEEVELTGVKLFAGLLLGGETVYKDYPQTVPYVQLENSVTAYMVAWAESGWIAELEDTDVPVLIWKYAPGAGELYVVNGDYLTGQMGAGLLTGFAANSVQAYVYPVVNAQISVVENFPMIADENSQWMQQEYGLDSANLFRDILWPSIVAIYYDTGDALTATSSLRLDYTQTQELDASLLQFYYDQITKESGEIGLSGAQVSQVPLEEKLEADLALYREQLPNYRLLTFQADGLDESAYRSLLEPGNLLEDVRTVLTSYDEEDAQPFFSYAGDTALNLPVYMDSTVMESQDDFRARCLQTAYGYYATSVDAARVVYPQSEDDVWNVMSEEWSKNYRPYRILFEYFEKLTASQADSRVRNYLSLEYDVQVEDEAITLQVDAQAQPSYFLLRLHGAEVVQATGGTCQEVETGWYLITAQESTVHLTLEQADKAQYYIE